MPPHPLSYARPPERCTCRHPRLRPCYNLKNALLLLGSTISAILVSDVLPFEWKCRNCFGKRRLSADEALTINRNIKRMATIIEKLREPDAGEPVDDTTGEE